MDVHLNELPLTFLLNGVYIYATRLDFPFFFLLPKMIVIVFNLELYRLQFFK